MRRAGLADFTLFLTCWTEMSLPRLERVEQAELIRSLLVLEIRFGR